MQHVTVALVDDAGAERPVFTGTMPATELDGLLMSVVLRAEREPEPVRIVLRARRADD